jgi:drug/metabolite transporter (DMT)-like permease
MKRNVRKYSHQAYSMLFMSGVLWGFSALFYKKSLAVVSITAFLAVRFVLGASFIFATERKKFIRLSMRVFGLIALFTIVDTIMINFLYSAGIQKTTAIHAAVIHLSTPFIVYFLAALFLSEKPHRRVVVGAIIAAIGMLGIIVGSSSYNSNAGASAVGDIILLLEAFVAASAIVMGRKLLTKYKKIPGEQLGFIEYSLAAVPFIIIALFSGTFSELFVLNYTSWLWIIGASILCGAIPLTLYNRSIRKLPAPRLADVSFISPTTSAMVGVILLGEQISASFVIGTIFVVVGLLISHNKIHPVYIAHHLRIDVVTMKSIFRVPKRAYELIRVEVKW